MKELRQDESAPALSLCREREHEACWVEDAVERANTRVFADDTEAPRSVLLCPHHGICLAAGEPCRGGIGALFEQFRAMSNPPRIRHVSIPSAAWVENPRDAERGGVAVKQRVEFRFERSLWSGCEKLSPPTGDGGVEALNPDLVRQVDKDLDPDFGSFWASQQEFLRTGVGFAYVEGKRVVSVSYSVFPLRSSVEVAVATRREFRGRGYALAAAGRLVDLCLRTGRMPCWSTDASNAAACRLAEHLGFVGAGTLHWAGPASRPEP